MALHGIIHHLAVFSLTAMAGNEVCVAAFVEPVLRRLPEAQQRPVAPSVAGALGRAMPFWYAVSLLLTIADWWLARTTGAAVAAGLQLLILVGTLALLVPINNRIAAGALQDGWLADARRWDALHQGRVVLLLLAAAVLIFQG
ncbi:MAG: anthrone oxygenase family protein [Janthinobacterium lividum]